MTKPSITGVSDRSEWNVKVIFKLEQTAALLTKTLPLHLYFNYYIPLLCITRTIATVH